MHRGGDVVASQPLLVFGDGFDVRAVGELEAHMVLDVHELREPLPELRGVGELDEQRGRELALVRNELVVRRNLIGDRIIGEHPLCTRHLLDLPAHGVRVLEHDGDEIADRDTPPALHLDDVRAEIVALLLVRAVVGDVVDGQLLHSSSIPYARAITCRGCDGTLSESSLIAVFAK